MPPPVPPRVNDGRMISGRPISCSTAQASSIERTVRLSGQLQADLRHGVAEQLPVLRLGDRLGAGADHLDAEALEDTRRLTSSMATFSAVCPPIVGSSASGRSRSMIFSMVAAVIGSM